jgi:hypothetical protein
MHGLPPKADLIFFAISENFVPMAIYDAYSIQGRARSASHCN